MAWCRWRTANIGALTITYTILGAPSRNYSIMSPKTLFSSLRPLHYRTYSGSLVGAFTGTLKRTPIKCSLACQPFLQKWVAQGAEADGSASPKHKAPRGPRPQPKPYALKPGWSCLASAPGVSCSCDYTYTVRPC